MTNEKKACLVGIDLGGTGSRAIGIVDGEIALSRDVPSAELGRGTEAERIAQLAELARSVTPENATLEAVGIGASGPVDIQRGTIHNHDTLPWFSGFSLVEPLAESLGAPVGIDNDAVAAAFGEHNRGAGGKTDRMLMVTLGTGVGVAMLVDGKPVRGADGAHPEGGHIPISSSDVRCYCGLTGCWEQAASRSTLQRSLSAAMNDAPLSRELISNAIAAYDTDERVRQVFHEYGIAVARGLGALHTLYQPRITVIGGGAAQVLPLIRDVMAKELTRARDFAVEVDIREAVLGDNAGAIGAALEISRVS